ncbi:DUF997 family protein [Shewanella psychrotolerans]|uniref:DUF997 family protein n=1 Tax=Shewanella psychrotolerans TaxID=2864206 RepID=UPI001C65ACA2|nr:DUF997 family protein [Shewanella psychrotolerans]QYK02762.1 DUF997 family protein [Shewanella psychrotolerans]
MASLSKMALALTGGYFILWCLGPLLLTDLGRWLGLPLWFWFSCIAAPILLVLGLAVLLRGQDD